MVTRAADPSVIEAVSDFTAGYHLLTEEATTTPAEARVRVEGYYNNNFKVQYETNGREISTSELMPTSDASLLLQDLYISSNEHPLGEKHQLDAADDGSAYSAAHLKHHPTFRRFLEEYEYYDIFLADWETGHIIYSVFKEIDYATSMLNGPHAASGLGEAFRAVRNNPIAGQIELQDFAAYTPSYEAAASFMSTPVMQDGEPTGVLIVQMPVGRINQIMTSKEMWADVGLGASGESYLVGPDYKLRSESRFYIEDPDGMISLLNDLGASRSSINSIESTGSAMGALEIRTEGTTAALAGEEGEAIFADYRDVRVLSAYRPVDFDAVDWVLMSEIDEAEVLMPVLELRNLVIFISVGVIILSSFISVRFAHSIAQPLVEVTGLIRELAQGLLFDRKIATNREDEIGELQGSYNQLVANFRGLIQEVQKNTVQLNSTAAELLATAQQQQSGATEQAASVQETRQTLTMLVEASTSVAENSQAVFNNAELAQKNADVTGRRIEELSELTQQIVDLLGQIKDIATKSDLLALNAALEGTKAGEAGRGFSLVANQMQRLSEQVMLSAKNIEGLTNEITKATTSSVLVTEEATKLAAQTTQSARQITIAINQQQQGTSQASEAVGQIAVVAQEAATAAGQTVDAATLLTNLSNTLSEAVGDFKLA